VSGQINSELRNGESDINIRDVINIIAHNMHIMFRNYVFHFATSWPQKYSKKFKSQDTPYDCQSFSSILKLTQFQSIFSVSIYNTPGNEHVDAMAKNGAKITQTTIRETPYRCIKLPLKQLFQSVYGHELEAKLSQKPRKQEIAKIPDWPRRKTVAEFRLCVGHDCLGAHWA
jgi:hypothetical protein